LAIGRVPVTFVVKLVNVVEVVPVPPFAIGRVPVTPVVKGKPVAFVRTPLAGVPRAGVTKVGEVANTREPVPVSSVTAEIRFAELGVARKVATFAPRPLTPVEIGKPVAFVKVAEEGVPSAGVTSVGEVARTLLPVPVLVTLTTFLLASNAKAVEAVRPDRVVAPLTVRLVNTPAPEMLAILIKSEPFQAQTAASPLMTVTPVVGPAPRNTMLWVLELALMTTYVLDCAGAVMLRVTVPPAVHSKMASREVLAAPVVVVRVTSASEVIVVVPATAESSKAVMELFTVSPHVPDSLPVTGRARPKREVYAVVMCYLSFLS
jgi:hypothetical protein